MAIDTMPSIGRGLRLLASATRLTVLTLAAVFFLLPLVWLLLAPTKTDGELASRHPFALGSFSRLSEAWSNLMSFNDGVVLTWAWNSVLYSVASLLIALAITLPAGYALATKRFAGRRLILTMTLVVMIVPNSALVLPLFLEMNALDLVNTAWAVILPSAFFPFGTYLAYTYYSASLPPELLDAGRIDGCSEWRLFLHIGLPLAKPLVGLLSFLSFTATWNNYFLPYVMLNETDKLNLPVGLQALISSSSALRNAGASELPIHRPEAALAGLVMLVPVAIVFLACQRFVTRGALTGATKG
ncbi:carbohydrate ABC transporter permease [Nocardioides carbamazepini]|jgi:multiple sugar transport system permease protein|uniref:carbohydrate ABC transporter permease n=1 Tax=Nocardioides carbamazepini TaxID=2854259 RepID=UPI00214A21C2|nr:carbohydrate ABC transporter permease [Nocardioides carbamazepini]MCR1781883.1 carbohydrate ABC transporter permease [Nocardioides carbamazepini]